MIAANLGNSTKVGGVKIDPSVNLALLTTGGFYQLGTWRLSSKLANAAVKINGAIDDVLNLQGVDVSRFKAD